MYDTIVHDDNGVRLGEGIHLRQKVLDELGEKLGVEKETVRALMTQTIAGSAAMLKRFDEEPATLRKQVTSPGGTTEAGIRVLDELHVKDAIENCVMSAEKRSRELASGK